MINNQYIYHSTNPTNMGSVVEDEDDDDHHDHEFMTENTTTTTTNTTNNPVQRNNDTITSNTTMIDSINSEKRSYKMVNFEPLPVVPKKSRPSVEHTAQTITLGKIFTTLIVLVYKVIIQKRVSMTE